MHFDLKAYQEGYGYPKLVAIKVFFAIFIVACTVIAIALASGLATGDGIVVAMMILAGISFGGMAWAISQCVEDIRTARQIKITLAKGKLHAKIVQVDGYVFGVGDTRVVEYYDIMAEDITSIRLMNCYIEIRGKMTCRQSVDGCSKNKDVKVCKIPRTFIGEDKILALGKVKDARIGNNKPKGKSKGEKL